MNKDVRYEILPDSPFGQILSSLARDPKVLAVVEIGTHIGNGSTTCFLRGFANQNQRLYSVDINSEFQSKAADLHKENPQVEFLCGRVSEVMDRLPSKIDVLLLDGGDGDSDSDFDLLSDRAQTIALDDSCGPKNRRQRQILKDEGWKVLVDLPEERVGVSVFQRP